MAGSVSSGDDEVVSDINIVPLVDVILVLLIVFMITMPTIVGSAPVQVDLPETESAAIDAEGQPLRFALKHENGKNVLYLEESPTNLEKIKAKLATMEPGTSEISLAVDRGIPYGEVINVMDLLSSVGLHKIALDTKHAR